MPNSQMSVAERAATGVTSDAAAPGRRAEMDIAELNEPGQRAALRRVWTSPPSHGHWRMDVVQSRPLENGPPRRGAEVGMVLKAFANMSLLSLPEAVKKGQSWYTIAHAIVLFVTCILVGLLFVGNTRFKMLSFMVRKGIMIQVVLLTLADWVRLLVLPEKGWEATGRLGGTTICLVRLAFLCLDALKGQSRWFRLFVSFFFMLSNVVSILQALFLNADATLFVIDATNTTITTNAVQASVGTSIVTLTASMLVTVWKDPQFQYCALYRSYLPKLAVETTGFEPESSEMNQILDELVAGNLAWRGWPRNSALAILLSVVIFLFSIVMSTTALGYADDGSEPVAMLVLRVSAIILGAAGSFVFFRGNVSWTRCKYSFSSTEGILWIFYTLVFAWAGAEEPQANAMSRVLAPLYTAMGLLTWLGFESSKGISRIMHTTITCTIVLTMAVMIYLTAFVWQDDAVLADLNGVGVPGVLTRYAVQRTCYINLLLLIAGSLIVSFTKNVSENGYLVLVTGAVLRRDILELESLNVDPDGAPI